MAKGKLDIIRGLTKEEFENLHRASRDPYFFSYFIYLINPVLGKVRFNLYPFQKKVLWYFLNKRYNIILKFRQAGITELIAMYCLWLAMFHPNKNIVILSLKERVAKKVLRKIKFMYRNLPHYMQVPIVNGRTGEIGTSMEIEFSNGSTIASIPTTEDAGRSEGLSLLVIDEAAIMRWAKTIWAAAFPTLSTGGNAIVNSTPYGTGNWYHETWVNACSGDNGFFPIRLKWTMHPERGDEWYTEQRNALGPRKTAQEIDGDFLTSGTSVFDLADIRAIEDTLSDWLDINENPELEVLHSGQLIKYKNPRPGERYWIGADVSTGRSRDYSAFSIMNREGEEFASYKGKIHPFKLGSLLAEWGKKYNTAQIGPEGNDVGIGTVGKLEDLGYPELYHSQALLKKKGKKRAEEKAIAGWYTTKTNRPVIISQLEEDIRMDAVTIKDPRFVEEAYTFIYDDSNKAVALGKGRGDADDAMEEEDSVYTDDTIMAKAITNHLRKGYIKPRKKIKPM